MTDQKPDVQALIEEIPRVLQWLEDDPLAPVEAVDTVRAALSALSALSGETETVWEYGARIFISGKVERITDNIQEGILLQSRRHGFESEWVADSLVRRRKAGPWEVVV